MIRNKKFILYTITGVVALLTIFFVWRSGGLNEYLSSDTPVENSTTIKQPPLGGDQDKHGCKGSAGYSWCETKQKCLRIWEEPCDSEKIIPCTPDQKKADACGEIYQPVCATVQIQCVKAPCYPVQQNFENPCSACRNPLVSSYTKGKCEGDKPAKICPDYCPNLSQQEPGWCDDGTIIPGVEDECGCMKHSTCKK